MAGDHIKGGAMRAVKAVEALIARPNQRLPYLELARAFAALGRPRDSDCVMKAMSERWPDDKRADLS